MDNEHERKLSADSVTAKRFYLVDDEEQVRAALRTSPDGFVKFDLNDTKGCPRIQLQLDSTGNPSLSLWTSDSTLCCQISSNETSGNGLTISDIEGRPKVIIGVPERGSDVAGSEEAEITVLDREGQIIWSTTCKD